MSPTRMCHGVMDSETFCVSIKSCHRRLFELLAENEISSQNCSLQNFCNFSHLLTFPDQDLESIVKALDEDLTGFEVINELPFLSDLDGKSDPSFLLPTNRQKCYNGVCYPGLVIERDKKELVLVPPDSPEDVNVTFHILRSGNNPLLTSFNYNTTSEELKRLPLHSCKRTIFLIHGWLDNITIARFWWDPILRLTEKYSLTPLGARWNKMTTSDSQVIFVDWSGGAMSSYYFPAVSNARIVSTAVADLIQKLVDDHAFDPRDIHLLGFSLGAHIAGFVGKQLQSN